MILDSLVCLLMRSFSSSFTWSSFVSSTGTSNANALCEGPRTLLSHTVPANMSISGAQHLWLLPQIETSLHFDTSRAFIGKLIYVLQRLAKGRSLTTLKVNILHFGFIPQHRMSYAQRSNA